MHDEPDLGATPYGQGADSPTVPSMGQGSHPYPAARPGTPQPAPAPPGAWPTPPAPPAWPQQGAWPPPPPPPDAPAARLSKPEALRRVSALKRAFIAGSVVAFGVLAGLAASHQTGVTSSQAAPNNDSSTTSPFAQPSQNNGGFFDQQPGGSGFGSNSPFQPPFSQSGTS